MSASGTPATRRVKVEVEDGSGAGAGSGLLARGPGHGFVRRIKVQDDNARFFGVTTYAIRKTTTMSAAGTPATQRIEEGDDDDDGFVTIKVQDTDRFRVAYTMRKTGKLQALFDLYYDRGTGRFFVDDKRLQGWQTPADFNMEDGDEVDVYAELLGGGGGRLPAA